jgi:glucosamine--fructose-6-phosphate aminotransferase (isomerizing)
LAAETALLSNKHSDQAHQLKDWLLALPALVAQIINDSQAAAETLAAQWVDRDLFTFVGAGPGQAAARFGAAKICEGCEAIGWFIGTEEFHHYEIVREGDPVFLVAPDDSAKFRAIDVAQKIKRASGVLYSVVPAGEKEIAGLSASAFRIPATPPALVGLPYTIPLQLAAWYISQAKEQASSPP